MKIVNSIVSKAFQNALLIHKEKIANHTFHLRLKLSNPFVNYKAGQQLRIFVGLDNVMAFNDLIRTYSVWHYDAANLEVDIAVCTFSNGQGAKWATEINVGETVFFSGPKGKFIFDNSAGTYFFLGDISALAPMYEIARQINSNKTISGFIYATEQGDIFKDKFSDINFNFLTTSKNVIEQIIELVDNIEYVANNTIIYIAGETVFCKELNAYFRKTKMIETKRIFTKPFWHPDRKGLE